MTIHSLAAAKEAQKQTVAKIKGVIRQHAISSVRALENGGWAVQLRFPLGITSKERSFLKSLAKETGITILVEDKVGRIQQLVR
jgi:hypothetical protein